MSILTKSHTGLLRYEPIVREVITGTHGRFVHFGTHPTPIIGVDERGLYADLEYQRRDLRWTYPGNKRIDIYYAKNYVDSYDVDGDRRRYNDYVRLMGLGEDKICPYFRYRNIYGNLRLEGCQQMRNLEHIDHIFGDVILEDMPHEIIFPDNLIIDGRIKIIKRGCWMRQKDFVHISEENKKKLIWP